MARINTFVKDWGDVYNNSIKTFSGKNKNDNMPKELDNVYKLSGELTQVVHAIEKGSPAKVAEGKEREKALKEFLLIEKSFLAEAGIYKKHINSALAKTKKETWPDVYRALKALITHIDMMEGMIRVEAETMSKEQAKLLDKMVKSKVDGKYVLVGFTNTAKSSLNKAAAAIQAIKLDPSPACYNTQMDQTGRDLNMTFNAFTRYVATDDCDEYLKREMKGIENFLLLLKAFGGGAKAKVEPNATKEQVLERLKEFSAMVKALVPYYETAIHYLPKLK